MSDMGKITDQKNVLIDTIRDGKIYNRYESARKALIPYPDKKAQADGIRRQAYLLTSSENREDPEQIRLLLEERSRLQADPLIAEYLNAERDLCRMLQRICMEILNVADLELDAFADVIQS